jgi:pyrroline-5-carboxylate reductase
MTVGKGVSAICRSQGVFDDEFEFVAGIFKASGDVIAISENEMNRIISVTGSSPAYVFMFIKAIYNGAIEQGLLHTDGVDGGLSERELLDAVCNTVIGAAELLKQGNKTPDEQIKTVCSKGGTTEKAVEHLTMCDFEGIISDAMKKCTERADELSRGQ